MIQGRLIKYCKKLYYHFLEPVYVLVLKAVIDYKLLNMKYNLCIFVYSKQLLNLIQYLFYCVSILKVRFFDKIKHLASILTREASLF